jgi:excisionase family DNA binding protein
MTYLETYRSPLVGRQQAAQYLGVETATLAVWASTKRYPLPFIKIGRLVKYKISDLEAFVKARTVGAEVLQ